MEIINGLRPSRTGYLASSAFARKMGGKPMVGFLAEAGQYNGRPAVKLPDGSTWRISDDSSSLPEGKFHIEVRQALPHQPSKFPYTVHELAQVEVSDKPIQAVTPEQHKAVQAQLRKQQWQAFGTAVKEAATQRVSEPPTGDDEAYWQSLMAQYSN